MKQVHDPLENKPKPKSKIQFLTHEDADDTWRLIGGLIIFGGFVIGLFVMEHKVGNPSEPVYLKDAIIHSVLAYLAGWIAGSAKRRNNNNGNNKP